MPKEFKALPKTEIRIEWDDTTNFIKLLSLFKRQVIQSPSHTH